MKTSRAGKATKTKQTKNHNNPQSMGNHPGGGLTLDVLDAIAECVHVLYLQDRLDEALEVLRPYRVSAQVSLFHLGHLVDTKSLSTTDIFVAGPETYPGNGVYGLVVFLLGPTAGPLRTWWRFEPDFFATTPCGRRLAAEGTGKKAGS